MVFSTGRVMSVRGRLSLLPRCSAATSQALFLTSSLSPLHLPAVAYSAWRGHILIRFSDEFVQDDMANKSHLLLAHNPVHKRVPVLLHGDRSIPESLLIVEYVDEAFGGPQLLPSDPLARAAARFVDDKLWKALWVALWTEPGETQVALAASARESLLPEGKRFFGGDAIGLLDIAASGVALWLGVFEEMAGARLLGEETHPALCRWARE